MKYYAYLLQCSDGSLYAGYTTDLEKRLNTHNAGKGAKYTRSRLPVSLAYWEEYGGEHAARSREWHLKQMSHAEKLALISERAQGGAYRHHLESIERLKQYFLPVKGLVAVVLDGSVVKGNARADSDIDAVIVVTEERYRELLSENRLAEVITGHCTYEGGYFDVKYKTKEILRRAALRASEPTRNAYVGAQVVYSTDEEIAPLVEKIAAYPEWEREDKVRCFNANLQLNRGYFLHCVEKENAYMRAHLAQEIVYSVYRLILAENRVLFPCNRRLEERVLQCEKRPANVVQLANAFLKRVSVETCEAFVSAFWEQSALPLTDDVSENCSQYVRFYEDWWLNEHPPFPNEW